MAGPQSPKVSFGSALMKAIFLARRLKTAWAGQEMVGLLLPPSVPGALVNFAAMLLGKVPVNLNYTLSEQTLASCIRQCEIKTVVTSEGVSGKGEAHGAVRDWFSSRNCAAQSAAPGEKLAAFFMAWMLPAGWLERALGRAEESRTGRSGDGHFFQRQHRRAQGRHAEPLQHRLEHRADGTSLQRWTARDRFSGVLPFFHSFGFTGTLCLPAVLGVGVVYHPNPLDAKTIGPLVCDYKVTFLLATPTFLQLYMRGCAPEQFGSVRVVAVGAEKLPERLASAFEEQFGIRPFEAYGCTECAPAVAVNTHDFRSAGFRQVGVKRGRIGHPVARHQRAHRGRGDAATRAARPAGPDAGARPQCDAGLSGPPGEDRAKCCARAGMSPATLPRWTRTVSSRSPTA